MSLGNKQEGGDVAHPRDREMLEYARRHFAAIDRIFNPDAAPAR
jgi:hypothetical protein